MPMSWVNRDILANPVLIFSPLDASGRKRTFDLFIEGGDEPGFHEVVGIEDVIDRVHLCHGSIYPKKGVIRKARLIHPAGEVEAEGSVVRQCCSRGCPVPAGLPPHVSAGPSPTPSPTVRWKIFRSGAPVAQVLDTYIIAVAADGALVLVDQHAAHERLTHEALKSTDGGRAGWAFAAAAAAGGGGFSPRRLQPRPSPPAPASWKNSGLVLKPFGPGAVLVRALPAALGAPRAGAAAA